jgi:hypothetical protein
MPPEESFRRRKSPYSETLIVVKDVASEKNQSPFESLSASLSIRVDLHPSSKSERLQEVQALDGPAKELASLSVFLDSLLL